MAKSQPAPAPVSRETVQAPKPAPNAAPKAPERPKPPPDLTDPMGLKSDPLEEGPTHGAVPEETAAPEAEEGEEAEATEGATDPEYVRILAEAVAEWRDTGEVPKDLLEMPIALKNGDEYEFETLDEVIKGRMMAKDHMRGVQARDAERAQESRIRTNYESHFEDIAHPETGHEAMYDAYTRNGLRKQLVKLAERMLTEEQEDHDTANGAAYAAMARLGIRDPNHHEVQKARNEALARCERARLADDQQRANDFKNKRREAFEEQRGTSREEAANYEVMKRQLDQLRPRAFQRLGLDHDNPKHREKFDEYMGAVIRRENLPRLTPDAVWKAAKMAKQELNARPAPAVPQRQGPKPFVGRLGASGGRKPGAGGPGGKQERLSTSVMETKFGVRKW